MKRVKRISNAAIRLSVLLYVGIIVASGAQTKGKQEKQPVPDFTQGGKKDENHDWNLGPTGTRGWVYGWAGNTAEARQILVTAVDKGRLQGKRSIINTRTGTPRAPICWPTRCR
ncbi:MAG: hypothetical protein WCK89_02610 [bacterium]